MIEDIEIENNSTDNKLRSDVKFHAADYKDNNNINEVKNKEIIIMLIYKDDNSENENDNKKWKRHFIGVSGGVCTATPGIN